MKHRTLVAFLTIAAAWSCLADTTNVFMFTSGFSGGGIIPDGDVAGWSDTRNISGVGGPIQDVNVWLELSDGYNGDIYGYLTHSSGFAVLLNRAGRTGSSPFGYPDAGMYVKFDDSASNGDIHFYHTVGSWPTSLFDGSAWGPDGRNVNPATVNGGEPQDSLLADFVGLSGDGNWTLFLADLSVGDETTVVKWGIEISAIPEPSAWALWGLGLLGVASVIQYRNRRH